MTPPEQHLERSIPKLKKAAEIGTEIVEKFGNDQESKRIVKQELKKIYQEMKPELQAAGIKNPDELAAKLGHDFEQTFEIDKTPQLSLPETKGETPTGKEYFETLGDKKGTDRDKQILEDLETGKIELSEENYQFSEFQKVGKDGTTISFFAMNGPARIGKENPVPIPTSPQLAAGMRKYGIVMPTPGMVSTMYTAAAKKGTLRPMVTLPSGDEMESNRYLITKGQKVEGDYSDLDSSDFRIGTGKTKVISHREQEYGHHEYGGAKTTKIPANFDQLSEEEKRQYVWQIDPAHGGKNGSAGPKYADYSSELQGVYEYITVQEPGKPPKQILYEEALAHPKYGAILTGTRPLSAERSYAHIAKYSSIV